MLGGVSRFLAALTLVAAPPAWAQIRPPGPAQTPAIRIPVPRLDSDAARERFAAEVRARCHRLFNVQIDIVAGPRPSGSYVRQFPDVRQTIACDDGAVAYLSDGTLPPQPFQVGGVTGPAQTPAIRIPVPRLDSDAARERFAAEVRARCHRLFNVQIDIVAGPRPSGSYVRQFPDVRQTIACDDGAVAYLSDGTLPPQPFQVGGVTGPAQTPAIRIPVPRLDSDAARERFAAEVRARCHRLFNVQIDIVAGPRPSGSYVRQFPDVRQTIACDDGAVAYLSDGTLPPQPFQVGGVTGPAQTPAIRIPVPRLDSDAARERFAAEVRARCHRLFNVQIDIVAGPRPSGSYVRQFPDVRQTIACDDGAVAYLSDGTLPPQPFQVGGVTGPAQTPAIRIPVPRLDSDAARERFAAEVRARCHRLFNVQIDIVAGPRPSGSYVRQFPDVRQTIACDDGAVAYLSDGTLPPQPFQVGGVTGPAQTPAIRIPVPRLDSDAARERFAAEVRARCHRLFNVQIDIVAGPRPSGSYVRQFPDVRQTIACDDGAVAYLSDGTIGPQPFQVDRLDSDARRAAFEDRASSFCTKPYRLRLRTQPDGRAPRTYISQDVPPDTIFTCASKITVTLTIPLPPWLMPDFHLRGAATKLQRTAVQRCHTALPILDLPTDSILAKGTLIAQKPLAGTPIDCAVTVRLTRARPITIPGVVNSGAGAVDDWMAKVAQLCGSSDGVVIVNAPSDKQPGTILSQSIAARTPYKCGMRVIFTEAIAAPPFRWWLVAIIGGLVAAAGVASYFLRTWPWPPIPTLEIGTATSSTSLADDGPTAALPLIALESLRPEVTPACPDGLPMKSKETRNG